MAKPKSNDFVTYVLDMLAPLGHVTSRPMFGGHNIALDALTFGIIVDDALYLKADDENRPRFESLGLGPFVYRMKDGKPMAMSYFHAPDCLDDWDALEPFARGALGAAQRAKAAKAAPKRKPAAKKPAAKKPAAKKLTKPAGKKTRKRR